MGGREHVQQAIVSADTAIRLYRSAEDDDQSVGDLDGTEATLGFVLNSPPERRSASIVRRLTALGRELSEPQYRGAAAHLRERFQHTAVLAASPAAHPPELPT